MSIKKRGKQFTFLFLKTLNPKYYRELSEKKFTTSIKYFVIMLLVAFILTTIMITPKILTLRSDIENSLLDISKLKIKADFETVKPVSLPNKNPLITLDTTNNKTMDTEFLLITNKRVYYNVSGNYNEIDLEEYDFTQNKEDSRKMFTKIATILLPSVWILYYIAYFIKYLLLLIPLALLAFAVAKVMKNHVGLKQAIALSLYTSTGMVFIEVLTIPFFIKDYLFTYSPFIGINISAVAITIYLTLYVTSIRLSGNPDLKE